MEGRRCSSWLATALRDAFPKRDNVAWRVNPGLSGALGMEGAARPVVGKLSAAKIRSFGGPHVRFVEHESSPVGEEETRLSVSAYRLRHGLSGEQKRKGGIRAHSFLPLEGEVQDQESFLLPPLTLLLGGARGPRPQDRTNARAIQTITYRGPETKRLCLRIDLKQIRAIRF